MGDKDVTWHLAIKTQQVGHRLMSVTTPSSRLNRVLKAVCGMLIIFVASHLVLAVASLPRYYQRVTTGQVPTVVLAGDTRISNELVATWAAERGMTLQTYALYSMALQLVITLGFMSVGMLILWKARSNWFHWFTALVLLFYPSGGLWNIVLVSQVAYQYVSLGSLLWPSYLLFLYLFPNGRAMPRWTRWPMGVLATIHLMIQTIWFAAELTPRWDVLARGAQQFTPVVSVAFVLILGCQVYRYVRGSSQLERAQIKWFVAGLAFLLLSSGLFDVISSLTGWTLVTTTSLRGDVDAVVALLIPATIGIGILRYRLYDIDIIIRRTLVYGSLTVVLGLVYLVSVVLLQRLLTPLFGPTNDLSIVASTLAIAALFHPLRRRIQAFIDRRFYRQKYDAAKTLQVFSAHLRDEVDVRRLSDQMLLVVQETLQPEQVSLWMRPTK